MNVIKKLILLLFIFIPNILHAKNISPIAIQKFVSDWRNNINNLPESEKNQLINEFLTIAFYRMDNYIKSINENANQEYKTVRDKLINLLNNVVVPPAIFILFYSVYSPLYRELQNSKQGKEVSEVFISPDELEKKSIENIDGKIWTEFKKIFESSGKERSELAKLTLEYALSSIRNFDEEVLSFLNYKKEHLAVNIQESLRQDLNIMQVMAQRVMLVYTVYPYLYSHIDDGVKYLFPDPKGVIESYQDLSYTEEKELRSSPTPEDREDKEEKEWKE